MLNTITTTAQYSIAAAAALMLFTASPTFAAKKAHAADKTDTYQTAADQSSGTAPADNASSVPAFAPDPAPAPAPAATDTTPAPAPTPEPQPVKVFAPATTTATATPAESAPAQPKSAIESTLNAIEAAVASAKPRIFPKQAAPAPTSSASSTGTIATTGIASLFEGSAMAGNVYASDKFGQSDTYKLLALSLALAAAGLFLTNTKAFSRTFTGLTGAFRMEAPPVRQPSRSRA